MMSTCVPLRGAGRVRMSQQQQSHQQMRHQQDKPEEPILGVLLVIALLLRVWTLDIKPPHFDEGINGHFVIRMWKEGYYHYDPTNFHGPLYFYFLQLSELVFGRGVFAFRFVTALMSVGIVYLVGLHRRFF